MRIVLADLVGRGGFVSKDTVAGGYGSRFTPWSRTTGWFSRFKRQVSETPSVHMAYLAAIFAREGHEVVWTNGEPKDGDLALVISSLIDYRHETSWADAMRTRGIRVGFIGLAASKLPQLFVDHADFILDGEPEGGAMRLARGERLDGITTSGEIADLDSLPFPRWDLVERRKGPSRLRLSVRPTGGAFPLLASRGCPEFCTYCPHRILGGYRQRSVSNVVDEIAQICEYRRHPYIIFRDPVFSADRDRLIELCDEIRARGLRVDFDCETRLDRLDDRVLDHMRRAGLRGMSFGVESVSPQTLRTVGRRPIPPDHQRAIIERCREMGIVTMAFYLLGFPTDDWKSIGATIDYAIELGSTFAQFKLLTPYPGTPLWKQLEPVIFERDWERFDGFTPTFTHPHLSTKELMFLLGAAYAHFYTRPSYLANVLRVRHAGVRKLVDRMDRRVTARLNRKEMKVMRTVTC